MQSFKARHYKSGYIMPLREINHVVVPMVFDTGAVNTAISLLAYYRGDVDFTKLIKQLKKCCPRKAFHTASGTPLDGYLVYAENVNIAGIPVERFYYYLLPELKFSTALIGDDFIKNCIFQHDLQGDIEIQYFDIAAYQSEMADSIGQTELNRLLGLR